jgi:predicted methyltransferase
LNSNGQQFDLAYNNRLHYLMRSLIPKYFRNFIWEHESMRNFTYNQQRPTHRFLATLPVFVDGLEEFLTNGHLEFEDNLLSFTETGVEFKSSRTVEHVDEVCQLIENRIILNLRSFFAPAINLILA